MSRCRGKGHEPHRGRPELFQKPGLTAMQTQSCPRSTETQPTGTRRPASRSGDKDICAYATGLWSSFPDLTFEEESIGETGTNTVAAQWIMRGTNGTKEAANVKVCFGSR